MNHHIFLSLGSNLGDREQNLTQAYHLIRDRIGEIVHKSSVYETAAWGNMDQPPFLNLVLETVSSLQPQIVLQTIHGIEETMGRKRIGKWGIRTIDIDILLFDNQIIDIHGLQVPHPEMTNRNFVLIPLAEIAPDTIHPRLNKPIKDLLSASTDVLPVERWSSTN